MAEVKHFLESGVLTGRSGKEYKVTDSITVGRWTELEKFQSEMYYGRTGHEIFQSQKRVHELLNASKYADAVIENWNTMNAIAKVTDKKKHSALMICALFINSSDEDLGRFNEDEAEAKIADWSEYDVNDFFLFAKMLLPKFTEDLDEISNSSTPPTKDEKKKPK